MTISSRSDGPAGNGFEGTPEVTFNRLQPLLSLPLRTVTSWVGGAAWRSIRSANCDWPRKTLLRSMVSTRAFQRGGREDSDLAAGSCIAVRSGNGGRFANAGGMAYLARRTKMTFGMPVNRKLLLTMHFATVVPRPDRIVLALTSARES